MKIKQYLLNNSLDNFDKIYLPNNLKQNLFYLYRSTIKEFLSGLIPLLTAKSVSKVCLDFIIYDPQIKTNDLSSSLSKINSPKIITKKNFFNH
ncbi:unnamed protein product [Rotaria sordida]|uniref:Uncharacterized protein n=1 Tax=Rotaria sordida TaxID=392033 RepID=A0A813VNZ8_9BILA|nr:unnamed protein product [Rotaria sordida]CAF0840291.1 unnamed protein product [Rotaria sordida]CAF3830678.1 unnamed protein product [Rotaria sordida]